MKTTELRIGNFLNFHNSSEIIVAAILKDRLSYWNDDFSDVFNDVDDFQPIPLTEEWLLKFGYKKVQRGNIVQYEDSFEDSHEFNNDGSFAYCIGTMTWIDIQYVHQLQNIYFALTNEELKSPS